MTGFNLAFHLCAIDQYPPDECRQMDWPLSPVIPACRGISCIIAVNSAESIRTNKHVQPSFFLFVCFVEFCKQHKTKVN